MNSSTASKVFAPIGIWAKPGSRGDDVKIGHLELLHENFTLLSTKEGIEKAIKQRSTNAVVIFVGSELEKDVAVTTGVTQSLTYIEFHRCVEKHDFSTIIDPRSWEHIRSTQKFEIPKSETIPEHLVMVFSVEPRMPADCALALATAMRFVAGLGDDDDYTSRLLAISPEEPSRLYKAMLKLQEPNLGRQHQAEEFKMNHRGKGLRPRLCHIGDTQDTTSIIHKIISSKGARDSHVVVCFPPFDRVEHLRAATLGDGCTPFYKYYKLENSTPLDEITKALTGDTSKNLVLLVSFDFRCPVNATGFDTVRLVMGLHQERQVYDREFNQVITTTVPISPAEFEEQLSWSHRFSCAASKVVVYADVQDLQHPPVTAGHEDRMLDFENKQIGGFLAGILGSEYAFSWSAFDLATLFNKQDAMQPIIQRLWMQDLLVPSQRAKCGIELSPRYAELFQAILPIVKYDYRIAHFVTSAPQDPVVARVKVQLGALLAVGLHTIHVGDTDSTVTFGELAQSCRGYARPLANKGTMWLKLGLWKLATSEFQSSWAQNRRKNLPLRGACVKRQAAMKATELEAQLAACLRGQGIEVADGDIDAQSCEIDQLQQHSLSRALLEAYAFQFTALSESSNDGRVEYFTSILVGTELKRVSVPIETFSCDEIRRADPTGAYQGICSELERSEDGIVAKDWTWVPSSEGAAWTQRHCGGIAEN